MFEEMKLHLDDFFGPIQPLTFARAEVSQVGTYIEHELLTLVSIYQVGTYIEWEEIEDFYGPKIQVI
jgi:hypothetical protein